MFFFEIIAWNALSCLLFAEVVAFYTIEENFLACLSQIWSKWLFGPQTKTFHTFNVIESREEIKFCLVICISTLDSVLYQKSSQGLQNFDVEGPLLQRLSKLGDCAEPIKAEFSFEITNISNSPLKYDNIVVLITPSHILKSIKLYPLLATFCRKRTLDVAQSKCGNVNFFFL